MGVTEVVVRGGRQPFVGQRKCLMLHADELTLYLLLGKRCTPSFSQTLLLLLLLLLLFLLLAARPPACCGA